MAGSSEFTGVDFYDMDSLLSEEERAVRDTVRQWVDDAPDARDRRVLRGGRASPRS